jgi:hypothetical protein
VTDAISEAGDTKLTYDSLETFTDLTKGLHWVRIAAVPAACMCVAFGQALRPKTGDTAALAEYQGTGEASLMAFLSSLGTGGRARRGAPTPASSPPPGLAGHTGRSMAVLAAAVAAIMAATAVPMTGVSSAEAVSPTAPVGRLATAGEAEVVQLE